MSQPMKLCAAACLWMVALQLSAQVPEVLILPETGLERAACAGTMNAGTIRSISTLGPNGQNVRTDDPIVLCYGEQIFINHEGDADLSSDPVPATEAGIGYAFYTAVPTETGDDVARITIDPALLDVPPPPNGGIWVARGNNNSGDATFVNNGNIQNTYFSGGPGRLWFAPITITDFNGLSFDDGSCLNVRVDQFFSVLYLNEINLSNLSTPPGALMGNFTVQGGLPEFDPTETYSITIFKEDDPSVIGTIDVALVFHDGNALFTVPEPGNYIISIMDATGCSRDFTVSVPADADPVGLCFTNDFVPADGSICMPVLVSDFQDILSSTFTVKWDPTILEYTNVANIHPGMGSNASFDEDRTDEGILPFLWFDLSLNTLDLNDNDTLFEICFNAIGTPGSRSALSFTSDPTPISITDTLVELPVQLKDGSVTLTLPALPTIYYQACPDGMGTVTLSFEAFGGGDPYSYEVQDGTGMTVQTGNFNSGEIVTIPTLPSGNYVIEVTDINGISSLIPDITADATPIMLDTIVNDPTCQDVQDGRIVLDRGGTPLSLHWTGPGLSQYNVDSITGLGSGNYQLSYLTANGCADTLDFELEADTLAVSFGLTPPACVGQTGEIRVDVVGAGGGDYTWEWEDADGNQVGRTVTAPSPNTLNNVEAGTYTLTLTSGACSITETVTLNPLKILSFQVDASTTSTVACNGDTNGRIDVSVSADRNQSAFDFFWDSQTQANGLITIDAPNDNTFVTNLPPGDYGLQVVDADGCEIDTVFTIAEPDSFLILPNITPPDCPDGSNGRLDVGFGVFGGTEFSPPRAPYNYRWYELTDSTSVQIGRASFLTNLSSGRYGLAIEDANGCMDSTTIELFSGPQIRIRQTMDLVCPGDSSAALVVEGDLAGNDITWSTGANSSDITQLKAGVYAVSVTEFITQDSACTSVDTFQVRDPDFGVRVSSPMQFSPRSVCNEPDSGVIFNLRTNYRGPLEYIWPSLGDSVTAIPFISVSTSGDYPFIARDRVTGCVVYDSVVMVQFPERIAITVDSTNVSCNGDTDGALEVQATGRGGLFNFSWSTGDSVGLDSISRIPNLAPGIYSVTVTESADSSCQVPLTLEVREPDVLTLALDSAQTRDIRCFGESNGSIGLIWEGGNREMAPDIRWSGDTLPSSLTADNLSAGQYRIVLTDSRGCADSVSVMIMEPPELIATFPAPMEPVCNGFQTDITVDAASGGTGTNYTFSVDNGPSQPLSTTIPIFAGEHLVAVFDEAGCRIDTLLTVTEPEALQVDLGEELSVGLGDSIRLDPLVTSVDPVDTYIWNPVNLLSCDNCPNPFASPQEDQMFEVIVVDVNGCEGSDQVLIRVDKARNVYIPNGFTPNGDGFNDRWQIFTGPGVNQIKGVHLFDRWGNLMFESGPESPARDGTSGWDGRYNGQLMRPGVYVYLVEVEFIDGRILTYRGDVTMAH